MSYGIFDGKSYSKYDERPMANVDINGRAIETEKNGGAAAPYSIETREVVIYENEKQTPGPAVGLEVSDFVIGDTYIVTVDGVDYTDVAEWKADETSDGGNGVRLFNDGEYPTDFTDAPISIGCYSNGIYVDFVDSDTGKAHSVKVTHLAKTVVLDPILEAHINKMIDAKLSDEDYGVDDGIGGSGA